MKYITQMEGFVMERRMAIPYYELKHRGDLAKVGGACYVMGAVTTLLIVAGYFL